MNKNTNEMNTNCDTLQNRLIGPTADRGNVNKRTMPHMIAKNLALLMAAESFILLALALSECGVLLKLAAFLRLKARRAILK